MINEAKPPNGILDVPELSAYAKLAYIYLFLCADSSGQAFPSEGASSREAKCLDPYGETGDPRVEEGGVINC